MSLYAKYGVIQPRICFSTDPRWQARGLIFDDLPAYRKNGWSASLNFSQVARQGARSPGGAQGLFGIAPTNVDGYVTLKTDSRVGNFSIDHTILIHMQVNPLVASGTYSGIFGAQNYSTTNYESTFPGSGIFELFDNTTNVNYSVYVGNTGWYDLTASPEIGVPMVWIARRRGSDSFSTSETSLWNNQKGKVASIDGAGNALTPQAGQTIGYGKVNTNAYGGQGCVDVFLSAWFNTALSDSEIVALLQNPYSIYNVDTAAFLYAKKKSRSFGQIIF